MFEPSRERQAFEAELKSRPAATDSQWMSVYEAVGEEFTRHMVAIIEHEAGWPEGKLLPDDSLHALFHGSADEDMPFARFRADVRHAYGVDLSFREIVSLLDLDYQTLDGLIRLIGRMSRLERS